VGEERAELVETGRVSKEVERLREGVGEEERAEDEAEEGETIELEDEDE
jgi:hypothetical protein